MDSGTAAARGAIEKTIPGEAAAAAEAHDAPLLLGVPTGWCWLGAVALFSLPVARWWRLTDDADAVIVWSAVVCAFGAWVVRACRENVPLTTPGAALTGLGTIAGLLWLLAGLGHEDPWVLRVSFVGLGVAATWLLWGWTGPIRGLRPIAALGLLAVIPPGMMPFVESPPWVCRATAVVGGGVLQFFYPETAVEGAKIHLAHGSVLVGGGCTAVPLLVSLAHLLVPALLIFRISWPRALAVAAGTAVGAIVLAQVRVGVMAAVVDDKARFDYWHGPTGASWFTAAGMLVMAWGIDRALRARHADEPREVVNFAPGQGWTLGGCAGISAAIAGVGWLLGPQTSALPQAFVAPELAGYRASFASEPSEATAMVKPDAFLWQTEARYASARAGATIEVKLAYAPCLLDGDPVHRAKLSDGEPWPEAKTPAGAMRVRRAPGKLTCVATLPAEGAMLAHGHEWDARGAAQRRDVGRWRRWLAQRAPLRDKRAFHLQLAWTGTGEPPWDEISALFSEWATRAAKNFPPPSS